MLARVIECAEVFRTCSMAMAKVCVYRYLTSCRCSIRVQYVFNMFKGVQDVGFVALCVMVVVSLAECSRVFNTLNK